MERWKEYFRELLEGEAEHNLGIIHGTRPEE